MTVTLVGCLCEAAAIKKKLRHRRTTAPHRHRPRENAEVLEENVDPYGPVAG